MKKVFGILLLAVLGFGFYQVSKPTKPQALTQLEQNIEQFKQDFESYHNSVDTYSGERNQKALYELQNKVSSLQSFRTRLSTLANDANRQGMELDTRVYESSISMELTGLQMQISGLKAMLASN